MQSKYLENAVNEREVKARISVINRRVSVYLADASMAGNRYDYKFSEDQLILTPCKDGKKMCEMMKTKTPTSFYTIGAGKQNYFMEDFRALAQKANCSIKNDVIFIDIPELVKSEFKGSEKPESVDDQFVFHLEKLNELKPNNVELFIDGGLIKGRVTKVIG